MKFGMHIKSIVSDAITVEDFEIDVEYAEGELAAVQQALIPLLMHLTTQPKETQNEVAY